MKQLYFLNKQGIIQNGVIYQYYINNIREKKKEEWGESILFLFFFMEYNIIE